MTFAELHSASVLFPVYQKCLMGLSASKVERRHVEYILRMEGIGFQVPLPMSFLNECTANALSDGHVRPVPLTR